MKCQVVKVELRSNNICYGPEPAFTAETDQTLVIFATGKIIFKSYRYGDHAQLRQSNLQLTADQVDQILYPLEQIVTQPNYQPSFVTDVGAWQMKLTFPEKNLQFTGLLYSGSEFKQVSRRLRKLTKISDLFAFDNEGEQPADQFTLKKP